MKRSLQCCIFPYLSYHPFSYSIICRPKQLCKYEGNKSRTNLIRDLIFWILLQRTSHISSIDNSTELF